MSHLGDSGMTNQASKGRPQRTATPNFRMQMYFQVYNILLQVRSKNGDLEVDPLGKDVGNKSIGGFSQGKGHGNHVPEMESLMPQKNNYEPNDGKDGGVPGDARELL